MASEQTPDLDDLRALLDIVPVAPFELLGADYSTRTVSILFDEATPRAELEEQAQAAMALLMDLPATLRGLIELAERQHAQIAEAREQLADMAANAVDTHGIDPYSAQLIRDALLDILGEPDGGAS